jgi:hypothetical protein
MGELVESGWWRAIEDGLNVDKGTAVHQPLLLLLLLARCLRGEEPSLTFAEAESELLPLLETHGRVKQPEVLLPFWHLRRNEQETIWELDQLDAIELRDKRKRPTLKELRRVNPRGRVPARVERLLRDVAASSEPTVFGLSGRENPNRHRSARTAFCNRQRPHLAQCRPHVVTLSHNAHRPSF